jgi:cytoskeletal protein CcmA (bactofilin family)
VKGPLRARHVDLEARAEVEGDITCQTIAVESGARISGAVWQSGANGGAAEAGASTAAQGARHLFHDSLWASQADDGLRPLKVIRPRG